jgi:DNA-binding NtrC family response regulator
MASAERKLSVLVIDDDKTLNQFLTRSLSRAGLKCTSALGGVAGLELIERQAFDAVVCDVKMDDLDGLEVLKQAHQKARDNKAPSPPPFIMITAYAQVNTAVEAMKSGAADYLPKPVDVSHLQACILASVDRGVRRMAEVAESAPPRTGRAGSPLVGSRRWLEPFLALLDRVARTDTVVLIDGETGTGKSAVAREIARRSRRADKPFVEVNCGAIPANLIERELFGNETGAFTDAKEPKAGVVLQAEGGTLFLDEIGELPLPEQTKLLSLLSERTFTPLGATQSRRADVRFVAATNRDLETAVAEGRFRQDLYYRLNVMRLTIPPLRERADDVPNLVEHFRERVAVRVGHPCPEFTPEALNLLVRSKWPGNVRELENVVERMAILVEAGAKVKVEDLPSHLQRSSAHVPNTTGAPTVVAAEAEPKDAAPPALEGDIDLRGWVSQYERALIVEALRQECGNRTRAAKRLKVKRTTLIEKIARYEIGGDEYGGGEDED